MRKFRPLDQLPIRYKLLISFFAVIILAVLLSSTVIYSLVRDTIETNIESELKNSTETILNMVRTSVTVSIKNHLRAVAERNLEVARHFYELYQHGELTEAEAKRRVIEVLLSQRIGETGYIYCVDSKGVVVVHPKRALYLVDVSGYEFVRQQTIRKEGYIEYDWKNPDEATYRPKALYMTYFAPWDWIISVSSYREEFSKLVNVADFQDSILSLRFGKTGYPFVLDGKGNLVIHPKLQGENVLDSVDASNSHFVQEICRRKSGKLIYNWKNPDEAAPRTKLVIFNYIPELDWIVASASYLNEFYAPLETLRNVVILTVIFSLILALPITFHISRSITNPVKELTDRFATGATGDFSVRVDRSSRDELGQLASFFNTFMSRLEEYSKHLQGEILERKQAEQCLRRSEEMFSKAFRSSPNGICITSLQDGRFFDANESFQRLAGYSREELMGKRLCDLEMFPGRPSWAGLPESFGDQSILRGIELEFITSSKQVRTGMLSAELIELDGEQCVLLTLEDITESRRLEREIMEVADRERRKIGEDLHDDLCPHLIGIEVLSKVMGRKLREKGIEEAADADKIRELIIDATDKTRRLARGLCPVYLVADGLESALKELATSVQAVFGVACRFRSDYPVLIRDYTVATHLFRIVQEAVHNAFRHGRAGFIGIELSARNGRIALRVEDDGCGMPEPVPARGMGLQIMSYRARIIGASIEFCRGAERGTVVVCSLRNQPKEA
jgi:PAS domain S-box-containing protein